MIEAIAVSQILLWLVIICLVGLNIILLRQVGVLFERVAPAGALATSQLLDKGQFLNAKSYDTIDGNAAIIGGKSPQQTSQLVLFVAPDCPVCKEILPAAISMSKSLANDLELILASAGENVDQHKEFIKGQNLERFKYILSDNLGMSFGVAKLPYAVLINSDATVASFGLVNTREHLESLVEAQSQGVVSLQEYMGREPQLKRNG